MKNRRGTARKLISIAEFKANASKPGFKIMPVRRELAGVEVKANEDGTLSFVASTADVDRMGDTIDQAGWEVSDFLKNPVFLWAHSYATPPVGKVGGLAIEDSKLKAKRVEIVPRELSEFAWAVGEMYRRGFLNAVSVGFMPIEWSYGDNGGMKFIKQALLELSAVPVPANPNALGEAKTAGLWLPSLDRWVERTIDESRGAERTAEAEYAERAWNFVRSPSVQVPADDDDDKLDGLLERLANAVEQNTAAVREHTAAVQKILNRGSVGAPSAASPGVPPLPSKGAAPLAVDESRLLRALDQEFNPGG